MLFSCQVTVNCFLFFFFFLIDKKLFLLVLLSNSNVLLSETESYHTLTTLGKKIPQVITDCCMKYLILNKKFKTLIIYAYNMKWFTFSNSFLHLLYHSLSRICSSKCLSHLIWKPSQNEQIQPMERTKPNSIGQWSSGREGQFFILFNMQWNEGKVKRDLNGYKKKN